MSLVRAVFVFVHSILRNRMELAAENLALRQQLAILREKVKRPNSRMRDRIFWAILSLIWTNWRSALLIVQPETVVRWHREGFRLFWRWKSRAKRGRPTIEAEVRALIRQMSRENPCWGVPRIQSKLALLGHAVGEATVRKYRVRPQKPPSQTWRAFLTNHLTDIVAIDFFTVPTATFRMLFAFVVMRHDRRHVVHFNATAHPTAEWTAQQVIEAFPDDTAPRFMIRDRDSIYTAKYRDLPKDAGVKPVRLPARSPNLNAYAERWVRTVRESCLNRMIFFGEDSLRRAINEFLAYYHHERNHQGLGNRLIDPREKVGVTEGAIECRERLGGLLRYYHRQAA